MNVLFFSGGTEFLLFSGCFKVAMDPAVLVPAPLRIVCSCYAAKFIQSLFGEPGGHGCQTERKPVFLKTSDELLKLTGGNTDIVRPEKYQWTNCRELATSVNTGADLIACIMTGTEMGAGIVG
jgi:hypothetical protein